MKQTSSGFINILCLTLFRELECFRYEAAAAAGFKCVEVSLPYGVEAEKLKEAKERLGLEQVLITSPPGLHAYVIDCQ